MIRWLLNQAARRFGKKYQYDTSYFLDVIDTSRSAGLRLALFPKLAGYRGPKQGQAVVLGALLASTLDGDCGPCTQLVIDMASEAGVPTDLMRASLDGDLAGAGDVGLGVAFAQAAIVGDPGVDALAQDITQKFGRKTLVAASFGAATGRFYPVFKRGLGHGEICQKLRFDDGSDMIVNAHG